MKGFASERDLWLGVWIWTFLAFGLGMSIYLRLWGFTIAMVVVILFTAWIWWGTAYYITENSLKIKCGPFSQNIPLNKIKSVKRSRNYLAGCALSLDRLQIFYGNSGFALVSPKDRDVFIKQLQENTSLKELNLITDPDQSK